MKTATQQRLLLPLSTLSEPAELALDVPYALSPLLAPARYKGAHGGRGGAKSHFFAEQMVLECYANAKRCVCIREVQNTIKDSVKQLIVGKIEKLNLGNFFRVLDSEIRGANGSLIIFKGMQAYNAENIKSLEDFDIAWVEEAQTFSAHSLRLLRPTIRKDGSELWFSWNARHDSDPVDKFFRGGRPPTNSTVVSVNWMDNPWFPDVLRQEKDDDYANDPEMAEHVWGGGYEIISEGSYYAKLIHQADKEGRIGNFPYDPHMRVDTAWDIGVDDYTSIWFIQNDGHTATVVDFYEISNEGAQQIVELALPELNPDITAAAANMIELGREEPFSYGRHYLPHDVKNREWGAGARQRSVTLMGLGVKPLHVGVATNPAERIESTRRILPQVRFNDTPRIQQGISRLRRYSRKLNVAMDIYVGPLHDENSHAADAFGEYAINAPILPPPVIKPPKTPQQQAQVVLLGAPEAPSKTRIKI